MSPSFESYDYTESPDFSAARCAIENASILYENYNPSSVFAQRIQAFLWNRNLLDVAAHEFPIQDALDIAHYIVGFETSWITKGMPVHITGRFHIENEALDHGTTTRTRVISGTRSAIFSHYAITNFGAGCNSQLTAVSNAIGVDNRDIRYFTPLTEGSIWPVIHEVN